VVGADETWLLVTNLAPTRARVREYADWWQIERLFLSWKSHGWDLEAGGMRDPARLGSLAAGVVDALLASPVRPPPSSACSSKTGPPAAGSRERGRPPVQWDLPDWDAPTWSCQAHQVYAGFTP
jgi:hypothetical protein